MAAVSPGLEEQHWEAGASSADLGCWILRSSAGSSSFTALPCGRKVELVTRTAPTSSSLSLFACFSLESTLVNEALPICLSSLVAPCSDSLLIIYLRKSEVILTRGFYRHRQHRSLDSISPRNQAWQRGQAQTGTPLKECVHLHGKQEVPKRSPAGAPVGQRRLGRAEVQGAPAACHERAGNTSSLVTTPL